MPHLSPMNWILMLTFSLIMIMMLNSISWWNYSTKFTPLTNKTNLQYKSWQW